MARCRWCRGANWSAIWLTRQRAKRYPRTRQSWSEASEQLASVPEDSKILTSHKRELASCLSPIHVRPDVRASGRKRRRPRPLLRALMPPAHSGAGWPVPHNQTPSSSGRGESRIVEASTGNTSASSAPDSWLVRSSARAPRFCSPPRAVRRPDWLSAERHGTRGTAHAMRGTVSPRSSRPSRDAADGALVASSRTRDGARATRSAEPPDRRYRPSFASSASASRL